LYQKFYSASRYDRIVGGGDSEISPRLTLIRRPGFTVYNPGPFPPINRFHEFRAFTATDEVIHLLADCDGSTNQLQNPNFDSGATGWTFGSDPVNGGNWHLGTGSPFGAGNLAQWSGTGAAALTNQQHMPCSAGTQMEASCQGIGELGATGTAVLQINFYNAANALLQTVSSPACVANYIWTPLQVLAPAPAGTSYATVDFSVTGATMASGGPRWGAAVFTGGIAPIVPTVREVTQPNTNNILWTKAAGAGRTSFVDVGNTIYAGDGVTTHQWVTSALSWQPNAQFQPGDFIVDSNGNLQRSVGSVTATIVNISVVDVVLSGGVHGRQVTLYFSSAAPFDVPDNISIITSGLTTVPAANETTPYTVIVESVLQCSWVQSTTAIPVTPFSVETGTATTGSGSSGATMPAWNTSLGLVTQDGGNQWVNMGPAVMAWGAQGPANAPTVTTASVPSIYPNVAISTWYAPNGAFVIFDGANLQQLVAPGGTTGPAAPTWATAVGAITNETSPGTAQWKCLGGGAWQANHAYAVGDTIKATYTYSQTVYQWTSDGHGGFIQVPVQQQVTTTSFFQCVVAGTSGPNAPNWLNGIGVITRDNTVNWKNLGSASGAAWPGATQTLSTAIQVVDPNGYFQTPTKQAETGATAPTGGYSTTVGASTTDGAQVWKNAGPAAPAATAVWYWAYSGKNSITGEISNASPLSAPLAPGIGQLAVIQGQGLPQPPWDTIVLWRTAAGGSTLLYDDEFPNPGPGQNWIYTDTNVDPGNVATGAHGTLNALITAPINNTNDPPPSNFVPQAYFLNRIWGYVNNQLRWSGGPDTLTGSGNSSFPPLNVFRFPARGVLCWPTSVGLICFTTSDIWVVLGQGTGSSPFYVVNFQQNIGMQSQDAFAVNGSTAYAMISAHQVISIDPGAGEVEVGFPIGDIFDGFDPSAVYLTWHQAQSKDTALYVANGNAWWYRMAAASAPESGNIWSPAGVMRAPGQVRAMASIEITPGVKMLLAGPNVDGNPILQRDYTTNADNGVSFIARATLAPTVLAQPGTTAGVQFVVTEEKSIPGASPLSVRMLFDEIEDFVNIHAGDWRTLRNITTDPPNLPQSKSVKSQRLWGLQDPSTVIKCRFYQQDIFWPAENFASELYTNTVYGRLPEKARK
jgi:hypothetical protein